MHNHQCSYGNGGVSGTVAFESALRSADTLLSRVRAPPSTLRTDGGPKSLRSPCCGLALHKKPLVRNQRHMCYYSPQQSVLSGLCWQH
ncbi:hypothetical protein PoB_004345600 [Plakobranchus ocellatus]|uniref:Uncharacterized protein n=1 Tax=Plakobranchus ocellatus TaxID=259542 RepID=A0AAV4BDS0_9GAST|nr:hypothetical protein PoB_004345600 [Plakobranchus ocellatus]